jgi:hypothetical protein
MPVSAWSPKNILLRTSWAAVSALTRTFGMIFKTRQAGKTMVPNLEKLRLSYHAWPFDQGLVKNELNKWKPGG